MITVFLIPITFTIGYFTSKYNVFNKLYKYWYKYINKDRKFFECDVNEDGYKKITTPNIACFFHKEICKQNIILAVSKEDYTKAKLYDNKLKRYSKIHTRKHINNNDYKNVKL